jgi:uncharacterized membrane protein YfcA
LQALAEENGPVPALMPVVIGNWDGQRLRRHVAEDTFRKGMFVVLIVIGANLLRCALL